MKLLLVFSLLWSVIATDTAVVSDGSDACSVQNAHPENGGYYITGVGGYKDIMADEDPDDPSTYGDKGMAADDTLWAPNLTYPDGLVKPCVRNDAWCEGYGMYCCDGTEPIVYGSYFRVVHTCSALRFSFPADSGSTVYRMTNNATFQACDFSGAVEITASGTLPSGLTYVDYPFEHDSLDTQHFFASQVGCEDGQKIAVLPDYDYVGTYDQNFASGQRTTRIQHCDCDHAIRPTTLNEIAHTGFVDGCMSQLPDDRSCCPNKTEATSPSFNVYVNGGNCIPKNQKEEMDQLAKEVYEKCTDAANKAECDAYKTGDCPWETQGSAHFGNLVHNTMDDEIDGANTTFNPHCGVWYMISNCADLAHDLEVGAGFTGDTLTKIQTDITADLCGQSQHVAAYKAYEATLHGFGNVLGSVLSDAEDACSLQNGHPDEGDPAHLQPGGYYVAGVGGYKDIMADEDPDDPSTYGDKGQKADDTLWAPNLTYPNGLVKPCVRNDVWCEGYGMRCCDGTETIVYGSYLLAPQTCSALRFSFPADSDSTVYRMRNNATFQACDFSGAVRITESGTLPSGLTYVDFPFEHDSVGTQFFFASLVGCEHGQKIAVQPGAEYPSTYSMCFSMGTEDTTRIQHCDCDRSIRADTLNEICKTANVDGCMSQMPDDLSCCPSEGSAEGSVYVNGGNCIPKNKKAEFDQLAKEVYEKCTDAANKAECDAYKTGCPWEKKSSGHHGPTTYNTMDDEIDGANSTHNPHCDVWYIVSHCADLENGVDVGADFTSDTSEIYPMTITADNCGHSLHLAAYKMYEATITPEPTPSPTMKPTPPPTTKAAAEAASETAFQASGNVKVEVDVTLDLTPAALEGMRAAPVAAVTGLGDGMAKHLGKPIGTVRVAATVPDLGATGVFSFNSARRLWRSLQDTSLEVSYEVAVPESETAAMQAQLESTKSSSASLVSLTDAINSELDAEVGVSVAGVTVTSEIVIATPSPKKTTDATAAPVADAESLTGLAAIGLTLALLA